MTWNDFKAKVDSAIKEHGLDGTSHVVFEIEFYDYDEDAKTCLAVNFVDDKTFTIRNSYSSSSDD